MLTRINDFICNPALPTAYDDSLSYYQQLCKLTKKMNDIINEINALRVEEILKRVDERIDLRLSYLQAQIDNLNEGFSSIINNVEKIISDYKKDIKNDLDSEIAKMTSILNYELAILKNYVDYEDNVIFNKLKLEIDILRKELGEVTNVYVFSPLTGELITIQRAIDEIWENLFIYGLSAYEYDSLNLTAENYDNKEITAYEYDWYAKKFLWRDLSRYMYSPFTGELVLISYVVSQLAELHMVNGLTANEYDSKNLSAESYDSLNITAYNYDWNAKTIIIT